MKARLAVLILSCTASCLFGQGTVQFNTRLTGGSPPYYSQVFLIAADEIPKTGNTAANLPAGTQTYTGPALTGNGWTAQLFSIPGSNIPGGPYTPYGVPIADPYVGAFPFTTFRTGTAAGTVAPVLATLGNVAPDAASAVLQMRVFPSSFGSWAAAVAAYNVGNPQAAFIGASPAFVVNNIGGAINGAPQMTMESWSFPLIPEPSSLAILGLGVGCFIATRQRKDLE